MKIKIMILLTFLFLIVNIVSAETYITSGVSNTVNTTNNSKYNFDIENTVPLSTQTTSSVEINKQYYIFMNLIIIGLCFIWTILVYRVHFK